jgi:vancomycin resistance protein YoaR
MGSTRIVQQKNTHPPQGKALTAAVSAVLALLILFGAWVGAYPFIFRQRIYPGVRVAGIELSGLSRDDARAQLQQAVDAFARRGVRFEGFGHTTTLAQVAGALDDPDLAYELIAFDTEAMVAEAYAVGRKAHEGGARGWVLNALTAVGVRLSPVDLPARYAIAGNRVRAFIGSEFGRFESPAQDAQLVIDTEGNMQVVPEKGGEVIDVARAGTDLAHALERFESVPITLRLLQDTPRVNAAQVYALIPVAGAVLDRTPFLLGLPAEIRATLNKEMGMGAAARVAATTEIPRASIAQWLIITARADGQGRLGLDRSRIDTFLTPIKELLNRSARDAKFEVRDGKVEKFQGSRDGREVDVEATVARMEEAYLERNEAQAYVVFREINAVVQTTDVNALGIGELLGVGRSNFSGSPKNRRHNIGVGVAAVNGTLIPPGEEFSLLHTLGEVNAEAGYLPELVIKGNKTVPEYGGGLCQIGTTAFRTALATGLPITERRNHSYRVRYYEPAGTDATIYSPSPDFKFSNDTGAHLLFQARVEGDDAIFELWGTSDGRSATTTTPVVYNTIRPPPTKFIETTELKPGQKRCTESPHSGADARFTYTVAYPDGRIAAEEFKSHYRPWQEVCLMGVEKAEGDADGTVPPSSDAADVPGR